MYDMKRLHSAGITYVCCATDNKLAVFWSHGHFAPMESSSKYESSIAKCNTVLLFPILGQECFKKLPVPLLIVVSGTEQTDLNESVQLVTFYTSACFK